jgi:hypothetical protein
MEKISWIDCVRNGMLHRGKEEGNILHEISKGKGNWIGHILCRNCLLKHIIEGNIERRIKTRGIKHWQLLDNLKEIRKCCKLKETALDRTVRRIRCGRGCGPVIRNSFKRLSPEAHSAMVVLRLHFPLGTSQRHDDRDTNCIDIDIVMYSFVQQLGHITQTGSTVRCTAPP